MGYADPSYTESNLTNYYLITYVATIMGEADLTSDSHIGFEDKDLDMLADDRVCQCGVMIYEDYVSLIDNAPDLSYEKLIKIIGYCSFNNIEYKINGHKELEDL